METHKGRNHILLLLWCKGKLQLPLTTIFCRHQPIGGSNLSQLQLTAIKLQLDREAPTSSIYQTECLLIYLRYQICSVASLSAFLFLIFSASLFYTLPSLYLLFLTSLMHIQLILFIEFLTWLFVFHKEFWVNNHDSLASVFSFLYPTQFKIIMICTNFHATVGFFFSLGYFPMHHKQ